VGADGFRHSLCDLHLVRRHLLQQLFQKRRVAHPVSPEDLEKLFDDADRGANATLTIDLEKQEIRGPDGGVVRFEIDAHRKHCMLNGLDDIGLTKQKQSKIESYEGKGEIGETLGMIG
jgi:3-isopropylmalate/(R)-2-methylmalate dehydratase small subunit